jgi:peroxiredoxin
MSTLDLDIASLQQEMISPIPEAALKTIMSATGDLFNSGISKQALKVGEQFPAFELPNATGETVRSTDLLAEGPIIINFYRGGWCPYCNLELSAYQRLLPEIRAAGGRLVAISPQLPDAALSDKEKHQLAFDVLSDVGNTLAGEVGLVFTLDKELQTVYQDFGFGLPAFNGDESWALPI